MIEWISVPLFFSGTWMIVVKPLVRFWYYWTKLALRLFLDLPEMQTVSDGQLTFVREIYTPSLAPPTNGDLVTDTIHVKKVGLKELKQRFFSEPLQLI